MKRPQETKLQKEAIRDFVLGGTSLLVGLIVTIGTLTAFVNGMSFAIIAWGSILFGGERLIRALIVVRNRGQF